MKKTIQFVLILVLVMASVSSAEEGTWTRKANMPTARICPYTSVVNGKIYAIGGGRNIAGGYFSTAEEYEPTTDTWTRKANMPAARNGHAVSAVNGKIYVIGGEPSAQASTSTVYEYNPVTDTWMRKTDMSTKRTFLCACTLDSKIYAFGGGTAGGAGGNLFPTTMEMYDPAADTWTRKADMLTARANAAASVVNGKIYLIGGTRGALHQNPVSTVDEYDPMTDTWTRKTNMPTARTGLSTSVVDGRIYAIGGGIWNGSIFSKVEKYDPATDTWTTEPDMETQRIMLSTSVVNGKIYAIGGSMKWYPCPGISTVEEYTLTPQSPDFNGDGMVNIKDLLRLIGSWNQDDSLLDIAPPPFGDGIVDALDLELLMNYWEQPVDDPTLLTHWALDEIEGIIAYDTAGVNDAVVVGGTEWQPSSGQINGALQLDGIEGCAITNQVLNPTDGSFSVFAWIKGGEPGQVVISQQNGSNWLGTDPDLGCLMIELMAPAVGRFTPLPMKSESVITDGQWHHIGLVWDGSYRFLYVDGVEVAKDTRSSIQALMASDGGLYIGASKDLEASTFFFGLIDDIRIYDIALSSEQVVALAQ